MPNKHRQQRGSDPGHIIPYTKGTSNEISFSVLHSMRNAAEEEGQLARPAWEFPQDEVRQRRARRLRGKWIATVGIVIAALAVVGVLGALLVTNIQNQIDHVAHMKNVLYAVVEESEQTQPYNDAVSAALMQQIGTTSYTDIQKMYNTSQTNVSTWRERLQTMRTELEELQEHLQLPSDRETANQGITAINAQLNMLDLGEQVMTYALPAQKAYTEAEEAFSQILAADALDEEATQYANELNTENAQASRDASQQAADALETASIDLDDVLEVTKQLQARAPEVGDDTIAILSEYLAYVQQRAEAQRAATTSMQAYLDRDKTTLQQANDRYNILEQQAADRIAVQEQLPTIAFATFFSAARNTDADQWAAESARAAVALTSLRDYLA